MFSTILGLNKPRSIGPSLVASRMLKVLPTNVSIIPGYDSYICVMDQSNSFDIFICPFAKRISVVGSMLVK